MEFQNAQILFFPTVLGLDRKRSNIPSNNRITLILSERSGLLIVAPQSLKYWRSRFVKIIYIFRVGCRLPWTLHLPDRLLRSTLHLCACKGHSCVLSSNRMDTFLVWTSMWDREFHIDRRWWLRTRTFYMYYFSHHRRLKKNCLSSPTCMWWTPIMSGPRNGKLQASFEVISSVKQIRGDEWNKALTYRIIINSLMPHW